MEFLFFMTMNVVSTGLLVLGIYFAARKLKEKGLLKLDISDRTSRRRLNEQEMQRMMQDPYLNPGMDAVVDRHYHGINNGLDAHHSGNDNNNGSGGFNNGI